MTIALWKLVVMLCVAFGAGAVLGIIGMAACALASCGDCRLAAKPAVIYRCQLLEDGDRRDGIGCIPMFYGRAPGPDCAAGELPCMYYLHEGEVR